MATPGAESGNEADELDKLALEPERHFAKQSAAWFPSAFAAVSVFCDSRCLHEAASACLGSTFLDAEMAGSVVKNICKKLSLIPTNVDEQLHRARLRLRQCININWFGQHAR